MRDLSHDANRSIIQHVTLRELIDEDCVAISQAFAAQGWHKPISQYQAYLQESVQGKRVILVTEYNGGFAGYITILWESSYAPFSAVGIPEIADFNVLIRYQHKGIGTLLMDEAEKRIAQRSDVAGIGVGLTFDYGAAQVLYVKRGYVPDGQGVHSGRRRLSYGDQVCIDDDLVLYLTKSLL